MEKRMTGVIITSRKIYANTIKHLAMPMTLLTMTHMSSFCFSIEILPYISTI